MTDYRKLFDLTGKTAVVLGAASGIGKSSAETLARLGAHVICADRDHERCQATAAGIREGGGMADPIACDAASAAEVAALAESVKEGSPAAGKRRDISSSYTTYCAQISQSHPRRSIRRLLALSLHLCRFYPPHQIVGKTRKSPFESLRFRPSAHHQP